MSNRMNRRELLRNTAWAGIGVWAAGTRNALAGRESPNEKLNIAVIGCGGQGGENLNAVGRQNQNIVALCDVDDARAADAFETFPKAKRFRDFRKMFDQAGRRSTPWS